MLIDLSSHHDLAVRFCNTQTTSAIALLCGTLKKSHFCNYYNLLYTILQEKKKQKQNTWDPEYITYWNPLKQQEWVLFSSGMHAATHICETQNTTKITARNIPQMFLFQQLFIFGLILKLYMYLNFSILLWDLNSLITIVTCNHSNTNILRRYHNLD